MEDLDILKRFDNDKLIDIVKNYKRYGYDDEIRDYAINLFKSSMLQPLSFNKLIA